MEEEKLARYHAVLNSVVALFTAFDGFDYTCIADALDLLAENMDKYPTTVSLVDEIERRQALKKKA